MIIKVKVISRSRSFLGQDHSGLKLYFGIIQLCRIKIIQGQGHARSRSSNVSLIEGQDYLRSRSFKFKVSQGHSMLKSSHGQGHLKVTVILRSRSFSYQMVMCFDFYPQASDWLSSECLSLLVFSLLYLHLTCE